MARPLPPQHFPGWRLLCASRPLGRVRRAGVVRSKTGLQHLTLQSRRHSRRGDTCAVASRDTVPAVGLPNPQGLRRPFLKDYVVHGYALDEERLRNDPAAAQSLAEKVREIRFDEKNLYARVRDCVAAVASDYDGSSGEIRKFFAKMQDKFDFAACEQTAQQLLLARADGTKDRMGMTTQLNARPTLADAKIAENYLSSEEVKL